MTPTEIRFWCVKLARATYSCADAQTIVKEARILEGFVDGQPGAEAVQREPPRTPREILASIPVDEAFPREEKRSGAYIFCREILGADYASRIEATLADAGYKIVKDERP